ncbi:hypothetical protein GGI04_004744 [Coemansia thaxteri]|uniref:BLOC-1-related complex subunit 6 C-terminal helix domain-containing protein n=1 Tax=Coemansia thaxteri TaxID=2663907 RepID=A0A9W8BFX0_9FUNG|nr:hypothetical protein GGI04_004744 [Coemansia thaxteri]KAJ1999511.1 hypothetical protein H4R26_005029 [Coemansia thaxteri]KAJ2466205.1 hypothetical protein GGI02_004447 [Coemansia sp. RSA 2322]KAJ2474870.1 hypothetical protein EV174_005479 [Coemansia sp. RSA 2320]
MEPKSVEEYMERIRVLDALEQQAMGLSRMLATYTDRLQERLDQRAAIAAAADGVALASIRALDAAVADSVRQKRALVAQCQVLHAEMAGADAVGRQVREIRRLLDVMEYAKRRKS